MAETVGLAGLLLLVIVQWYAHDQERREWSRERAALLERCVPGLTLTPPVEPGPTPRYGTDEYEWEVEQNRKQEAV